MTKAERIRELAGKGLSIKEIAELLKTSPRYVRKVIASMKIQGVSESNYEVKIERERIRRQVAERKYIQLRRLLARDENIIQALRDVIPQFPVPEVVSPPRPTYAKSRETAVLLISDWHIGERVSEEETLGLGAFNREIAAARVELISEKVIDLILGYTRSRIDTLVIGALGDMVSGQIHEELERTQDLNAAEQIIFAAFLLANLLNELSAYFQIRFVGVVGNHGRLKKKKEAKEKYVNWDYIVYQITAMFLRNNSRVTWSISKSPHAIVEIESHLFLFSHGDTIRGWAGIPFYGISRFANNMREVLNKQRLILDGLCLGHFHQPTGIERVNGPMIVNGSLKGVDEYSLERGMAMPPSQILFGVSREYPKTFEYTLWLSGKDKPTRWRLDIPDLWTDLEVF